MKSYKKINNKIDIDIIVPVKTLSERVKNKNLRKFANTSLYELKLKQLSKTKQFKKIIISSESQHVLNVAKKYNFSTHLRDKRLSTSHVPMSQVYYNLAKEASSTYVAWVNVTNPLVGSDIYDSAAKAFKKKVLKSKFDCLLTAVENKENYFYKGKAINFRRSPWPKSQDLEPLVSLPFAINILRREFLIKWKSCVGKKPYFYKLNPIIGTDIDNMHNFLFCEFVYVNRKKFKINI